MSCSVMPVPAPSLRSICLSFFGHPGTVVSSCFSVHLIPADMSGHLRHGQIAWGSPQFLGFTSALQRRLESHPLLVRGRSELLPALRISHNHYVHSPRWVPFFLRPPCPFVWRVKSVM